MNVYIGHYKYFIFTILKNKNMNKEKLANDYTS